MLIAYMAAARLVEVEQSHVQLALHDFNFVFVHHRHSISIRQQTGRHPIIYYSGVFLGVQTF
ncbi:hypothetical protein WJ13_18505 [Burkholderia seminalis]|nr:hypothetical protein WJ13_18505 [Burkholderia seminalis]